MAKSFENVGFLKDSINKHLYLMITVAIFKMIESCDYFIFLESKNTIAYTKEEERVTHSPWIYYELQIVNILKANEAKLLEIGNESFKMEDDKTLKCFFGIKTNIRRIGRKKIEDLIRFDF